MDKFTAVGLATAAAAGDRIIVVTHSADAARAGLDQMIALGFEEHGVLRVARTPGRLSARAASGGSVRFIPQGGLSGASADTVLVEDGVRIDELRAANLAAVIATSPKGEVVYA